MSETNTKFENAVVDFMRKNGVAFRYCDVSSMANCSYFYDIGDDCLIVCDPVDPNQDHPSNNDYELMLYTKKEFKELLEE